MLVLVGAGELHAEIDRIAAAHPQRFRVPPFQNQSRMLIVYRLGDLVVLFSGYGETWVLAVNEALACGRPVLVSDRVGRDVHGASMSLSRGAARASCQQSQDVRLRAEWRGAG